MQTFMHMHSPKQTVQVQPCQTGAPNLNENTQAFAPWRPQMQTYLRMHARKLSAQTYPCQRVAPNMWLTVCAKTIARPFRSHTRETNRRARTHTHTHTRTCTHARTRAHTHTRTRTHTHIRERKRTDTHTHTHWRAQASPWHTPSPRSTWPPQVTAATR
jgi:hypothetical protein